MQQHGEQCRVNQGNFERKRHYFSIWNHWWSSTSISTATSNILPPPLPPPPLQQKLSSLSSKHSSSSLLLEFHVVVLRLIWLPGLMAAKCTVYQGMRLASDVTGGYLRRLGSMVIKQIMHVGLKWMKKQLSCCLRIDCIKNTTTALD